MSVPRFGEQYLNATIATRQAVDNPTASQILVTQGSCPGVGRIAPKTILYKDGTLYYKPQGSARLVSITTKGCEDAFPS